MDAPDLRTPGASTWRRNGCRAFACFGFATALGTIATLVGPKHLAKSESVGLSDRLYAPPTSLTLAAPEFTREYPGSAKAKFGFCPTRPSIFSAPLRWSSAPDTADHICCNQHRLAEYFGYWESTPFPRTLPEGTSQITFYDVSSGLPLFVAPVGRSYAAFIAESKHHGWPSFRDEEVVAANVRVLPGGETVSVNGTQYVPAQRRPRQLRSDSCASCPLCAR